MITYSTNWMGPLAREWFDDRGYDITANEWAGGRIDIRGLPFDQYYAGQHEYALEIMRSEDWVLFTEWLEHLKTTDLLTKEDLINLYEEDNGPIRWEKDYGTTER